MDLPHPTNVTEWDWETVQSLEAASESQYLEFKQSIEADNDQNSTEWRNSIEKEILAFANSTGGILVFGVDDNGNPSPFEPPEHEIKQAVTRFIENAKPRPEVVIPEPIGVPNEETNRIVLPIYIEEATRKPLLTHDSAVYMRLNDRKDPMSREQMESMFVVEDRRQQEIRQLEMQIERFGNIVTEDSGYFDRRTETRPPNFAPLNLESLKDALQENTALYGNEDLEEHIAEVFRCIRAIENLEVKFGREASGYAGHRWDSKQDHWKARRRHLRGDLYDLHFALKRLAEEAKLEIDFPDSPSFDSRG
ncbi:MAG: ATP-binding protein [Halopenitus sp.]